MDRRKFLCDQMCLELGRWLRAAGYDVTLAPETLSDKELFDMALEEHRLLLTKDKELAEKGEPAVYLHGEDLDGWAKQLRDEWGVDWLLAPFTRCVKCDTVLERVDETFWRCPKCEQFFWLGSHTDHMLERLKRWQSTT